MARFHVHTALATALVVLPACGGSETPPASQPGAGITVRGTEHLAWSQAGDVSDLRFRAFVDGQPVDLNGASCDSATPQAACISALPALTDGVHTLALTAISRRSGLESAQSAPLTVQKISGSSTSAPRSSGERAWPTLPDHATAIATSASPGFVMDVVATDLRAPAQIACDPAGRLFAAEADGRVRMFRSGGPAEGELALDAQILLSPVPASPPGLCLDPEFTQNHFVYVSFLARERPGQTLLRIVRLREVGGTLGEPASVFESPVIASTLDGHGGSDPGVTTAFGSDGPRLAFGPDGFAYVALPPGAEFEDEPAASVPHPALLRLDAQGFMRASLPPVMGVVAHPIAFDWSPSTGVLWIATRRETGAIAVGPVDTRGDDGVASGMVLTGPTLTSGGMAGALRFQRGGGSRGEAGLAFLAVPDTAGLRVLRFNDPVRHETVIAGVLGRIGDVAPCQAAALFLATRHRDAETAVGGDLLVRLTPRPR